MDNLVDSTSLLRQSEPKGVREQRKQTDSWLARDTQKSEKLKETDKKSSGNTPLFH